MVAYEANSTRPLSPRVPAVARALRESRAHMLIPVFRHLAILLCTLLYTTDARASIDIVLDIMPEMALAEGGSEAERCDDAADTCPAPTAVFFSATGTTCTASECTDPWRELVYHWDFGDSGAGNWATDGKPKNEDYGPIATHVYETNGTFTVTLTVTDPTGAVNSTTDTVYIEDPDTTWPATVTTCASNSSAGDIDFSFCPFVCSGDARCVCPNSIDSECDIANGGEELAEVVDDSIAAGEKRILLKGGETWTRTIAGAVGRIDGLGAGPILLASAGGSANPVNYEIDVSGNCDRGQNLFLINGQSGGDNLRIADINIDFIRVDTLGGAAAGSILICAHQNCPNNLLFLRVASNDACQVIEILDDKTNTTAPYGGSGENTGSHMFMVGDDTLWDANAEPSCGLLTGPCTNSMFMQVRYMAIQGLEFGVANGGVETRYTRNRIPTANPSGTTATVGYQVWNHNKFGDSAVTNLAIRGHLGGVGEKYYIADNIFDGQAGWNSGFNFANTYSGAGSGPGLQDIIFERNIVNSLGVDEATSRRLTVRNNLFGPNATFKLNCGRGGEGKDGWSDDFQFVHNSYYGTNRAHAFDPSSCASEPLYDPDIVCRNNVLWDTASSTTKVCSALDLDWKADASAYDDNAGRNASETVTINACPFKGTDKACSGFDYLNSDHWEVNGPDGALLQGSGTSSLRTLTDFANRVRQGTDIGAMETGGSPLPLLAAPLPPVLLE